MSTMHRRTGQLTTCAMAALLLGLIAAEVRAAGTPSATQWIGPVPGTTSLTTSPGDTVPYTLVLNVPVSGSGIITVVDTLPAYLQYVLGSGNPAPDPGWDPNPGPPQRLKWTLAGPFVVGSTRTVTFSVTEDWGNTEAFEPGSGDVAAPQGSALTNRAYVTWNTGEADVSNLTTANVDWFTLTSSATGNSDIVYSLTVKNRSASKTWWNVQFWDTVPAGLDVWSTGYGLWDPCFGFTMTPSGCPVATAGKVLSGVSTILTWKIDLAPGATTFVQWRAKVGPGAYCATVTNEASVLSTGITAVVGGVGASGTPKIVTTLVGAVCPMPAQLSVGSLSVSPPSVQVGQWFTVTFAVTNTGGVAATGVTPVLQVNAGGALAVLEAGPLPPTVASLAAGGTQAFSFTYSSSGAGTFAFTATASGTDTLYSLPISCAAGSSVSITSLPVVLNASLATSPATVTAGQYFLIMLTVTNSGAGPATNLSGALWQSGGGGSAAWGTISPASVASLAPGGSVVFSWTGTAGAAGGVTLTATASGDNPVWSNPASAGVTVLTPAALDAAVSVYPVSICGGQSLQVRLTVTNTGQAGANGVNAPAFVVSGTGSAAVAAGPSPALPVTLAGGMSRTFTWTYTGGVSGVVWFTTTVSGTDAVSGAGVSSGPSVSGPVTVSTAAVLDAAVSAPASASTGQVVVVTLTVTNTGGVAATSVTPAIGAGSGSFGTPSPAIAAVVPAGAMQTFSWNYTVGTAGTIGFTATASGLTCGASPVSAGTAASMSAVAAAVIAGSAAISPPSVTAGGWFTVTLTVTNTGAVNATTLAPGIWATAGGSLVVPEAGPVPPSVVSLAPGAFQTFSWTYSVSGAGTVGFTLTVSGVDSGSGLTIACSSAAAITISAPGSATPVTPPEPVNTGEVKVVGGIRGYLNPKNGERATLLVRPATPGEIRIRIYDERGRLVYENTSAAAGGRTEVLHWNGTDTSGARVPPGLYPVIIEGPGIQYKGKLIVVH
ncbi:MAG: hypothetical protein AAB152_12795 [Candidatus Coatesbacteria bacterium]